MMRSTSESIPMTINKLATGESAKVPHQTTRSENDNPPPLEDIPSAPVRQGTTWPYPGLASENMFKTRKDWPIPHTPVPTPAPTIMRTTQNCSNLQCHDNALPSQKKCSWRLHCPICKNKEEHREEDWDGNLQNQPRMHPQNLQPQTAQNPQPQNLQHPQPQTLQHPQSQSSQHDEKHNFQQTQL